MTPSSGPAYDGLINYKRSKDPGSSARRQSLHEQKPPSGFFGMMWYKYVLWFPLIAGVLASDHQTDVAIATYAALPSNSDPMSVGVR
ncbi:hypothetical protein RRF57_011160 [Xylaria bambusicola]|uniref:Uncharacterized protein n=1 Tax=Xylaria bambusicola TaxID=326684 RepID=A0AAN7UXN9_9PEZI